MTIAQAIEESAWGQSSLAARYHNLFGIKGTGPAGSIALPTQEYDNGSWVTIDAQFAVYHNDAESIADHAELLATGGYYARAMADRAHPDAFANDLTGVYATDPGYGANLIALMKLYNLYQYDTASTAAPAATKPAHHTITRTASAVTTAHVTPAPAVSGRAPVVAARYRAQLPQAVRTTLFATAKGPLDRGEHLYRDVAATTGGSWKLLAAADWMQCRADPRYSPVQGEKLGTVNADGTSYTTRTAALAQCASDLIELSSAVYGIDLTVRRPLSVRELAAAFAAFRWGALLKRHGVSPVEFPYSVAGLTAAHQKMRWPPIDAPGAPDRPGTRFRQPFGAVNADGTSYATRTAALAQCGADLIELSSAVYGIDLTARRALSVRELAGAFAAFRWGALLKRHGVSPVEFPYSVAGLTTAHQKMRWPPIDAGAPDRPGTRFRQPFGAVPVVLSLGYPATV